MRSALLIEFMLDSTILSPVLKTPQLPHGCVPTFSVARLQSPMADAPHVRDCFANSLFLLEVRAPSADQKLRLINRTSKRRRRWRTPRPFVDLGSPQTGPRLALPFRPVALDPRRTFWPRACHYSTPMAAADAARIADQKVGSQPQLIGCDCRTCHRESHSRGIRHFGVELGSRCELIRRS